MHNQININTYIPKQAETNIIQRYHKWQDENINNNYKFIIGAGVKIYAWPSLIINVNLSRYLSCDIEYGHRSHIAASGVYTLYQKLYDTVSDKFKIIGGCVKLKLGIMASRPESQSDSIIYKSTYGLKIQLYFSIPIPANKDHNIKFIIATGIDIGRPLGITAELYTIQNQTLLNA